MGINDYNVSSPFWNQKYFFNDTLLNVDHADDISKQSNL